MAANTEPIYSLVPNVGWGVIDTANTAKDGTGTVVTIFTAGSEGGRVESIKVRSKGTNVATVLRIWLNNGSTNATAGNNTLIMEATISATTVSEVAAQPDLEIPIFKSIPNGHKINITIGTSVAAGLHVTAFGGNY